MAIRSKRNKKLRNEIVADEWIFRSKNDQKAQKRATSGGIGALRHPTHH